MYIYKESVFSSLREELIFCLQSAQRLIESLDSLEYIGPMEMFTKLSKVRIRTLSNSARWMCSTLSPG